MKKVAGKALTIFMGDEDRLAGTPMEIAILEEAKSRGIAGASVIKGVAGYGEGNSIHSASILRLSEDLPVQVLVVDEHSKIDEFLNWVLTVVHSGCVTCADVDLWLPSDRE